MNTKHSQSFLTLYSLLLIAALTGLLGCAFSGTRPSARNVSGGADQFCDEVIKIMESATRPTPAESVGFEAKTLNQSTGKRDAPGGQIEHFRTTAYECANNLKDLVFHDQTAGVVFPGQFLWSGLMINGNLTPATEIGRKPYLVTLTGVRSSAGTTTNFSFKCSGSFSSYEQGMQRAVNSIRIAAPQFHYSFTDNEVNEAGLLKLGLSAKYLGSKASASLRRQEGTFKSIKYLSFDQTYFTAVIDTPSPCGIISPPNGGSDQILQRLKSSVSTGNGELAYVSRVGYGRRLLICISSDRSQKELDRALRFKYSGAGLSVSGSAEDEMRKVWASSTVTAVVIGGEAKPSLIKAFTDQPSRLLENVAAFLTETIDFTTNTVAVPVSFQAQYWRDNGGCIVAQTARYAGEQVFGYAAKGGEYTYNTPNLEPFVIPAPAGKRKGDGEMDTGDSCVKLSLGYQASISADKRSVEVRFTYIAKEYKRNCEERKDTKFESVAVARIPAPDARNIEALISPNSGTVNAENSGENFGFIPMSASGIIREASGRVDADGRKDYTVFQARCHFSLSMKLADGAVKPAD